MLYLSLIVCSRNRCKQLLRCLESIGQCSFGGSWELVIVDNGSGDETAQVVQEFARAGIVPVVYVFEPTLGLGNARNAGLRIARGEVLAFTDDDCYVAHDFLTRVWSSFKDPAVGYITGRIVLHDPTDYPATINESVTPLTFSAGSFLGYGVLQGANMAFRRQVLFDIGGFDPLFGAGALFPAAEDSDAAARVSAIGWSGRYCPDVVVRHHHGRKASDIPRIAKSYAVGRGAHQMKLLLRERRIFWFAESVRGFPRRLRWEPRALWEVVGAAEYACVYSTHVFRAWIGSIIGRSAD